MSATDTVLPGAPASGPPADGAPEEHAAAQRRLPPLLLAVVCGGYALGAATGWGSAVLASVMGDFGLAAAALAAALSCAVRGLRMRGRGRPAWLLFGASSLMTAIGNGTWGWYEVVLHRPLPSPSPADCAFLFFAPPAIVGLLVLAQRPRTVAGWVCLLLDGWLIAGSLFILSWSLALARIAHGDDGNPLQLSLSLAYPLLDIVLVSVVLGLRFRRGVDRSALNTALAGLAVTVVSDALWTFPAVRDGYHSGEVLDAGWFAGSLLFAWAPWASGRRLPRPAGPDSTPRPAPGRSRPAASWFSALTPYLAAAVCTAALLYNALGVRSMDRVVLVTGCTVGLALIIRQGIMLLDNISLAQELAEQEAHFRSLVQGSSDVIMIIGADGVLSYVSPAAIGVYGRDPAGLVGRRLLDLVHPDDFGHVLWAVRRFLAGGPEAEPTARVECRIRSGAGEWLHVESTVNRHHDGLILNSRDVSERVRLQAQLQHNAFHDALTDLPNRALFTDRIRGALSGVRGEGRTVAVLFLDLDGFKAVNDTAGHQAGDELLVRVARRLQEAVRAGDLVARLGGDEFAALIAGRLDEAHVRDIAERLRSVLSRPYRLADRELTVAASIGIAFAEPGSDPAALMRNADLAMYRAKSQGKDRVAVYSPRLRADRVRRTELEQRLRGAVRDGRLTLLHQPVVDLASGAVAAVEAQPRWLSAQGLLLTPAEFLPTGEPGDRFLRLTRWLVQQAVATAAARRRHEVEHGRQGIPVTLRLPAHGLAAPGMVETVEQALGESGLPAGGLILAVGADPSGAAPGNVDELARRMAVLRRLGVRLALHGLGTGTGSLTWLRRLPADILALDRALVQGVAESPVTRAVVSHMLRLGRDLGLQTAAEGVDSPRQAAVLRELGCRHGQGLLFAGPLDDQRLRRVLLRRSLPVPEPAGSRPPRVPAATLSDGRGDRRAARVPHHHQASDLPERLSTGGPHGETAIPPA
ncbi:putative bifunctional diguanylate cyclase/phosphodiesterase [Peterkaempfera sp. SMS 1(5)a]|uniref:putative bifunctional diguanylate cyclase/phosphodiesterase n=1 Tax=Peterkaempfera podocarpi TaxID=3232308 RepID=UPI00366D4D44